jgi:hypothetical protein
MKRNPPTCAWSVRSATDNQGRRIITLGRTPNVPAPAPRQAAPPTASLKNGLKLDASFAPEARSAFKPVVWVALPARFRAVCQARRELLNA